jgi:predicted pyridoxine 5'-phosphate oxidase superfamily flavin-nucleotide-binding protein
MPATAPLPSSDVAFTPSVKALQARKGSRNGYRRMEERGGWRTTVTPDLAAFLRERDSAYLATASRAGQPYVQHRGGPKGFIRVIDEKTLAFADYAGNRQYITAGNLAENDRAYLFLMDYAHRHRIKIWGRAKVVEDAEAIAKLMPQGYAARPEQAIVFTVEAWDSNCPQHIPQKFDAADVAATLAKLQARIDELEAENARLRRAVVPVDRPVYGAASPRDNDLAAGEGEADTSPTASIG